MSWNKSRVNHCRNLRRWFTLDLSCSLVAEVVGDGVEGDGVGCARFFGGLALFVVEGVLTIPALEFYHARLSCRYLAVERNISLV